MKSFSEYFNEQVLGLYEGITIQHVGTVKAKVDTGNGGYNVLHASDIKEDNNEVMFYTVNNKSLKLPVYDHVIIHIGSGKKEERPVVKLDVSIADKQFNQVPFSLGNRSDNEVPVLLSKDFIKMLGGSVNVNINQSPEEV